MVRLTFNVFHSRTFVGTPPNTYEGGVVKQIEITDGDLTFNYLHTISKGLVKDKFQIWYAKDPKGVCEEVHRVLDGDSFGRVSQFIERNNGITFFIESVGDKPPPRDKATKRKRRSTIRKQPHLLPKHRPGMGCDVKAFHRLIGKLTPFQKQWAMDMGFRHLLDLQIKEIDTEFRYWLMSRFDPATKTLLVRGDISIVVDEDVVGWVLGVPSLDDFLRPVPPRNKKDVQNLRKIYKPATPFSAITDTEVVTLLVSEHSDQSTFQRHFLLYTLGVLLCLT